MQADSDTTGVAERIKIPVQGKLAALWTSFMFLYAYVDILAFYKPGAIDDILAGKVWQLEITQTWAVGALGLMAVPILMVYLSVCLPARANRVTNIVVASLYLIVSVANAAGELWMYYFSLAVGLETLVLALIIRHAWTWPRIPRDGRTREAKTETARRAVLDRARY